MMMIAGSLFLWSYTALFAGALVAPELRDLEQEVKELGKLETQVKLDENTIRQLIFQLERLLKEKT